MNDSVDPDLLMAIRLYQSIIQGFNQVANIDGRVDPNGFTRGYLNSENSPRWQLMPAVGKGFLNHELLDHQDNHDYGTSWMAEVIVAAGKQYHQDYQSRHAGALPIAVNDVSLPHGGDSGGHAGHETGLSCDLRLPRIDGSFGGVNNPNTNQAYDRNAMRAQLIALKAQPLVRRVFFNDNQFVNEGLCSRAVGHGNHVHFDLRPKVA